MKLNVRFHDFQKECFEIEAQSPANNRIARLPPVLILPVRLQNWYLD
jgi:hypothetical protein